MKLKYEDDFLMIVDKPAGMVTTRENSKLKTSNLKQDNNYYLEDWVGKNYPNELPRKGIVHRLDKGTSGLVLVAKDNDVLKMLKDMFKRHQVVKKYLALAGGDLPAVGEVRMPIKRSKYAFGRFKVDSDGKEAITEFKVVTKIIIRGKIFSLAEVNLKTGRTHQIRVHFNYLGWPLAGDTVYGGQEIGGLSRQFLHAAFIGFVHPVTGKLIAVGSNLPRELQDTIDSNEK